MSAIEIYYSLNNTEQPYYAGDDPFYNEEEEIADMTENDYAIMLQECYSDF